MTGAFAFQKTTECGTDQHLQRQTFLSLYPRRDAFIWKPFKKERWEKTKGPLLDAQILGVISDKGRGLFRGCYWAHKTKHAVLDIDAGSQYRNSDELQKLQTRLAVVGLIAQPYQSSNSGGWHLYLFLDDWAECDEVHQLLKAWLKSLGYVIKSGQLEIFPSGNALRLPLQSGFAWLNSNGSIRTKREELTEDEAVASFLQDADDHARNWETAKTLITSQISSAGTRADSRDQEHANIVSIEGFDHLFNRGKILETWQKGREFWLEGLESKGQRHDAVLAVGHYLWYGDPEQNIPAYPGRRNNETRARLIEAWLKKKHNGFCNHINRKQWKEIESQIWRAVFWRREKTFKAMNAYPISDRLLKRLLEVYRKTGRLFEIDRMAQANNKREMDARARIASAIKDLQEEGQLITKAEIARRSGACRKTINRHFDLLASCGGVTNRGVWGGSSSSATPELELTESVNLEIPSDSGVVELEQVKPTIVSPLRLIQGSRFAPDRSRLRSHPEKISIEFVVNLRGPPEGRH